VELAKNVKCDDFHLCSLFICCSWQHTRCNSYCFINPCAIFVVNKLEILWNLSVNPISSGVPRNFVRGWGVSTNSVEERGQRERGSGGGSPLVRGSGGSCNFVQEISFHIVKFS